MTITDKERLQKKKKESSSSNLENLLYFSFAYADIPLKATSHQKMMIQTTYPV